MSGIKFNTGTCLLFVDDTEDDRPTEGGGGGGGGGRGPERRPFGRPTGSLKLTGSSTSDFNNKSSTPAPVDFLGETGPSQTIRCSLPERNRRRQVQVAKRFL